MKRPTLFLAMCAVLALAAGAAPAAAQKGDRPAKELELSATPARAGEQPPSRVVRERKSDGLSQAALIALMAAAAGLGALTTATIRPRRRGSKPVRTAEPAKPAVVKRVRAARPAKPPAVKRIRASRSAKPPAVKRVCAAKPAKPAKPPTPASAERVRAATPPPASQPTVARNPAPQPPPVVEPPRAPPPPQPEPQRFAPEPLTSETCKIEFHNWSTSAHFYAVPYPGGPVIARSPYFKIGHTEGDPGLSASEALRALVEDLIAGGWRQTGAAGAPWALQFERRAGASGYRPANDADAVSRSVS